MIRLRQVIVGARVKSFNPLVGPSARGQHQDRRRDAISAQVSAQLQPVDAGKQHVENQEVIVIDADLLQRGAAVTRNVDGVGMLTKPFREHRGGDGLVLDDEYPHGEAVTRRHCQTLRDLRLDPC